MPRWWENVDFKDLPLVSVITPSYNQGKFIQKNIESVISQDYPRVEYWIIDGGSKDRTLEVINKFKDKINYISEPDEGQADAINKGFRLSKGEILVIQNSDDYFCDGAISSAVRRLRENPDVAVVYGESYTVDVYDNIIGQGHKKDFDAEQVICAELILPQSSVFFHRSAVNAVGGCDPNINYCPDFNLWAKMACKFKMLHVNEIWSYFRKNPNSQIADKGWLSPMQRRLTIKRLLHDPDYMKVMSRLWRRAFASTYLEEAWRCNSLYSRTRMLKCIVKSILVFPLILFKRPLRVGYILKITFSSKGGAR